MAVGTVHRVTGRMKNIKVAMYAPFLYPWMLDLSDEISGKVKAMRFFTTGIYGNYPWKEYEQYACTFRRGRLFSEVIVHPGLFAAYIRYRPGLLILFATDSLVSLLLYMVSRVIGAEVVLVVEENRETVFPARIIKILARLKGWLANLVYRDAKVIIAESEASRRYLLGKGCAGRKIAVIPHGANTGFFYPKQKSEPMAARVGLSARDLEKKSVLFVGEFTEVKGAEYLVETILELSGSGEVIFLVPAFGQTYLKYKNELDKAANTRVYPRMPFADLPDLYSLADIVVVPSRFYEDRSSDRSPNSLIEGMACGKTVIGSNTGGIPTIMGDAGVLIRPNDSRALTDAILTLASDERRLRELGEKAKERADGVLNNRVYAGRILELYGQLVSGGRTATVKRD